MNSGKLSNLVKSFRTLWNPTSRSPQGQIKLWIDILTEKEAGETPMGMHKYITTNVKEPLSPPAPIDFELRAIIWDTKDVIFKDKVLTANSKKLIQLLEYVRYIRLRLP